MKRTILVFSVLLTTTLLCAGVAIGQQTVAAGAEIDKNVELMRKNIRSEKKQIIAMNLPLTETEATKFWPVYDAYAAEYAKLNDQLYALIKEYAANQKTLTDVQAVGLIKKWGALQVETAQLRQKYVPLVEKVIPGKKTALFFQIDRRLLALLDLQLASEIPLVLQ